MIGAESVNRNRASTSSRVSAFLFSQSGLIGFCLSVGLALVACGALVRHGIASGVVGYNLVPAERVLDGQIPYRDFVYNYTPGLLWMNALLFRLLGVSLLTAKVGVYFAKVASISLVFLVGRRYLPNYLPLLPVVMMLAWVGYGDALKVFPTQYGMPFLLAAWLCVLRAGDWDRNASRRTAFILAGFFAGMVFVFKQNVGLFALFAACAGAAVSQDIPGEGEKQIPAAGIRAAYVLLGFSLPVGSMAIYLATHSALVPMMSHFAQHSIAYQESKGVALPNPSALIASLITGAAIGAAAWTVRKLLPRWFAIFLSILFGALVLLVVLNPAALGRAEVIRSLEADVYYLPVFTAVWASTVIYFLRKRRDFESARVLTIGLLFSLAAFLEIFPRSDSDHLVRVLPPTFVLVIALLTIDWKATSADGSGAVRTAIGIDQRMVHRFSGSRLPMLAGISGLIVLLGIKTIWAPLFDRDLLIADRTPLLFPRGAGVMGDRADADRLNNVVAFIQSSTTTGDSILAVSRKLTSVYFFAARKNTTGLEWFDSPGVPRAVREDIYDRVRRQQFKLVVIGKDLADMDGAETDEVSRQRKRLLALLQQYYQQSELINGVTIFSPIQTSESGPLQTR